MGKWKWRSLAQHRLGISVSSPALPALLSGPPIPTHGYLQVKVHGHLSGIATRGFWLQLAALKAGGGARGRGGTIPQNLLTARHLGLGEGPVPRWLWLRASSVLT